jgi:hypothetical protein
MSTYFGQAFLPSTSPTLHTATSLHSYLLPSHLVHSLLADMKVNQRCQTGSHEAFILP